MESMIEKIAREIALASLDPETREAVDPETWYVAVSYNDLAIAAIKAMREPTGEMLDKGANGMCYTQDMTFYDMSKFVWRDMIDAALKEE